MLEAFFMALPPPAGGGAPCAALSWLLRALWAALHKMQMDASVAKRAHTVLQVRHQTMQPIRMLAEDEAS